MSKLIGKCEFCKNILDESYIDSICPDCHNKVNYKPYDLSYEELSYPYPKLNHPSDFIFPSPSPIKLIEKPKVNYNKNKYNSVHLFHILPIYKIINDRKVLSTLVIAWDFDFNNAYSINQNPEKVMGYSIDNFSIKNYAYNKINEECLLDIYTIGVKRDVYEKFNNYLKDVSLSDLSTYFQLFTSISWDNYETFKKTFYEYASVNYLLHLMEICKIGNMFDDFDSKLISFEFFKSHPSVAITKQEIPLSDFLNEEDKKQELLNNPISESIEEIVNNNITDFEDVYDYYSTIAEGAIAPVSIPLSAAAVRSANVYNKLYDLGYKSSLNVYSKLNTTTICPTIETENGNIYYIECNNNIMNGINIFNNIDEMKSILEEVYNEEQEDSLFIKLDMIPSNVISFIVNHSKNNKEFLTKIIDLKDKYGENKSPILNPNENNFESSELLKDFKQVEITSSTLFKYRNTHFKLKNITWAGNKHGFFFVDKNDNVAAFIISEDIPNDGYIYRDIPLDVLNVITEIEICSSLKNEKVINEMILLMLNKFKSIALATRNMFITEFAREKFRFLDNISNVNYFWLVENKKSLNETFSLNEAFNATKRNKIEETIYKTFDLLDKSGLNTKKYKDKFKSMSNEQFDRYMKTFLADKKKNFYLEVLPNKNSPCIKDAKNALDYLKVPTEEYVYFRHDGNKDDPIRTRYKVPVLEVSMRRLQQVLSKKNTYTLDIDKRNMKTGQVTSDNRIARISDAENYCLLTYKDDSKALKEFLGPRAKVRLALNFFNCWKLLRA